MGSGRGAAGAGTDQGVPREAGGQEVHGLERQAVSCAPSSMPAGRRIQYLGGGQEAQILDCAKRRIRFLGMGVSRPGGNTHQGAKTTRRRAMTFFEARRWIIGSSLAMAGATFVFFILAPVLGYP